MFHTNGATMRIGQQLGSYRVPIRNRTAIAWATNSKRLDVARSKRSFLV